MFWAELSRTPLSIFHDLLGRQDECKIVSGPDDPRTWLPCPPVCKHWKPSFEFATANQIVFGCGSFAKVADLLADGASEVLVLPNLLCRRLIFELSK